MIYAAVDPGLSGAIAFFNGDHALGVHDMPTMTRQTGKGQQVNGRELKKIFMEYVDVEHCFFEQVSARPGQGVSSMFRFGESYGKAVCVAECLDIPHSFVSPGLWKRRAKLTNKDKDFARTLAIQLFPHLADALTRKKDVGRADALLIGRFAK